MKECPVCKESFQDDLNFCDLDGSPLDGGVAGTAAGSSSKVWSFLGVGLLLAAVGITAVAIIFFPRGPSANLPAGRSQTGNPGVTPNQPSTLAQEGASTRADGAGGVDGPDSKTAVTAGSPDQTRLASKKAGLSRNDNSDSSLPNPKSVINSDDEVTQASRQSADETRPRTSKPLLNAEAGSNGSGSANPQGSDSGAKSAATSAARRRPKTQGQGDDADASGKKDDKKKGGFLRVFKKIFGHN
jgi:hypothetical protein